jgi:hypothetical protein
MFRKTGTVLSLATFAIGRARVANETVAWAQDSTQAAVEAARVDSSVSDANTGTSLPTVGGPWCGSLEDNLLGSGTISMNVIQNGSKIRGTWTDDLGAAGTFKGKSAGQRDHRNAQAQGHSMSLSGEWHLG